MPKKMTKEDIAKHPDNKIDEDFKGYPTGPAKDETINPETKQQEKTAYLDNKDGEKRNYNSRKKPIDEQDSDGSASAFDDK